MEVFFFFLIGELCLISKFNEEFLSLVEDKEKIVSSRSGETRRASIRKSNRNEKEKDKKLNSIRFVSS